MRISLLEEEAARKLLERWKMRPNDYPKMGNGDLDKHLSKVAKRILVEWDKDPIDSLPKNLEECLLVVALVSRNIAVDECNEVIVRQNNVIKDLRERGNDDGESWKNAE